MPGVRMNSRFALALYNQMGVTDLVADDESAYVALALQMTHQVPARAAVVAKLLANRHKLFDKSPATEDWRVFLDGIVARKKQSSATDLDTKK